jgi:hypothetical protein
MSSEPTPRPGTVPPGDVAQTAPSYEERVAAVHAAIAAAQQRAREGRHPRDTALRRSVRQARRNAARAAADPAPNRPRLPAEPGERFLDL